MRTFRFVDEQQVIHESDSSYTKRLLFVFFFVLRRFTDWDLVIVLNTKDTIYYRGPIRGWNNSEFMVVPDLINIHCGVWLNYCNWFGPFFVPSPLIDISSFLSIREWFVCPSNPGPSHHLKRLENRSLAEQLPATL